MQQAWDGLRLGLLALGYRAVTFVEICCPQCGDFRAPLEQPAEMLSCPHCEQRYKSVTLADGFVRHPGTWERSAFPLGYKARAAVVADDLESKAIRRRGNQKPSTRHYVIGARA
jgi:hypothetical protein